MREAKLRGIVDDALEAGSIGQVNRPIVAHSDDNVPAADQPALPRGTHDVEHVGQQRLASEQGVDLAPSKTTTLAGREDQSVGPQPFDPLRAGYAGLPARSSAVASARRVITVAR